MKEELTIAEFNSRVKNLIKNVIRKWWVIFIISLAGAIIGFGITKIVKPYYFSKLTFYIDDASKNYGLLGFAALAQELNLPEAGNFNNKRTLLIELLKSRKICKETLFKTDKFDGKEKFLIQRYIELYELPDAYKVKYNIEDQTKIFDNADPERLSDIQNRLINLIYKSYMLEEIEIDENIGGIVEISLKSDDEEFACAIINNHIESLLEFYEKDRSKRAQTSFEYLKNKKDSVEALLSLAESKFAQFEDSQHLLVKAEGYIEGNRLKREIEMLGALLIESTKSLEFARMNLKSDHREIRVVDRPVLPLDLNVLPSLLWALYGGVAAFVLSLMFVIGAELLRLSISLRD